MLVTFKIRHATTKPGESAYIVGNTDEFGNWIVSNQSLFLCFWMIQDSNTNSCVFYKFYTSFVLIDLSHFNRIRMHLLWKQTPSNIQVGLLQSH